MKAVKCIPSHTTRLRDSHAHVGSPEKNGKEPMGSGLRCVEIAEGSWDLKEGAMRWLRREGLQKILRRCGLCHNLWQSPRLLCKATPPTLSRDTTGKWFRASSCRDHADSSRQARPDKNRRFRPNSPNREYLSSTCHALSLAASSTPAKPSRFSLQCGPDNGGEAATHIPPQHHHDPTWLGGACRQASAAANIDVPDTLIPIAKRWLSQQPNHGARACGVLGGRVVRPLVLQYSFPEPCPRMQSVKFTAKSRTCHGLRVEQPLGDASAGATAPGPDRRNPQPDGPLLGLVGSNQPTDFPPAVPAAW